MTSEVLRQLYENFGPVVVFTIAVFLALEVLFLALVRRRRRAVDVDQRMKVHDRAERRELTLDQLRREPTGAMDELFPFLPALRRFVVQSGASISLPALSLIATILAIGMWFMSVFVVQGTLPRLLLAGLFGVGGPLAVLGLMRSRRVQAFELQLPEAIDVIVRSLRAGHPVPVAIAMVAREMPDPVGAEFAVASSEMTFGLDLEAALVNLRERAGQSDLGFLVVAIGMQAKTGGNLAEILGNLSKLLRDRSRMRRKITALSAEGRASAIALSLVPLGLFLFLQGFVPKFYGDVAHEPIIEPIAYITLFVWFIGVVVMYRMVNFRI